MSLESVITTANKTIAYGILLALSPDVQLTFSEEKVTSSIFLLPQSVSTNCLSNSPILGNRRKGTDLVASEGGRWAVRTRSAFRVAALEGAIGLPQGQPSLTRGWLQTTRVKTITKAKMCKPSTLFPGLTAHQAVSPAPQQLGPNSLCSVGALSPALKTRRRR